MRQLALGRTGLDQENVSIFHHVFLALGHHLALGLDLGLVTELLQGIEVVHNRLDKSLLKVSVNDTGSLGRLGAVANRPLPHFVSSGREKAAQLQCLTHLGNELGNDGVSADRLLLLLGLLLRLKAGQSLLVRNGDRDDGVALGMLLDPLGNLGEMLVLLADKVPLRQID